MEAEPSVSMRVITVIALRTQPCEALFFTRARKLHTDRMRKSQKLPACVSFRRGSPQGFGDWSYWTKFGLISSLNCPKDRAGELEPLALTGLLVAAFGAS